MFKKLNNKPVADLNNSDLQMIASEVWDRYSEARNASWLVGEMTRASLEGPHFQWENDSLMALSGGPQACEDCEGHGSVDCEDCEGSGFVGCDECNGEGSVKDDSGEETDCGDCDGEGEIECDGCDTDGIVDCDACDGEGHIVVEVYEQYIVSEYYARKLNTQGEITQEVCGIWFWGRQCTGQSVYLDASIQAIGLEFYEYHLSNV